MFAFLYIFMCTRSIEQIGCINGTLSKFIHDPNPNTVREHVFTKSVHDHPSKVFTNK